MWHALFDPFAPAYMRRALAEVLLLGVFGGVVGVHVLLRRLAFVTEVVQHTVFPGIATAFVAGRSILAGALVAGVVAVVLLTIGSRRRDIDPDALMALLIATFFAIGVIVVSRRTGFQSDLTALLFGRILTVDQREIIDTLVVAAVCLTVLALLHKELVLRAFDPLGAEALGYPIARLDLTLNLIVMLVVVVAVQALGTVLVVAFIVTPAAAAAFVTRRIGPMMAIAALFAAVGGWLGLLVSYHGSIDHGWRLASGATVVLVLTLGFLAFAAASAIGRRWTERRARSVRPGAAGAAAAVGVAP
jgi:manganese/iron transport system permease protein